MSFNLTTFALEVLNFLVLMLLLGRLVFRPLRDGIARRRAALEQRENATLERLADAEKREDEVAAREAALGALRGEVLSRATEEASQQRARILDEARREAEAQGARAHHLLETERAAAASSLRELAVDRSTELAGQLLRELAPEAVEGALCDHLVAAVRERAAALRAEAARPRPGADDRPAAPVNAELVGATLPPAATAERLRRELTGALERAVQLGTRADPSLGAGLVLRVGHTVLDASLSGQLAVLREHARRLFDAEEATHE